MITPQVTNGQAKPSKPMLWTHPDPESTRMTEFMQRVNQKYHLDLQTYDDLFNWSIDQIGDFWSETWDFTGIVAEKRPVGVSDWVT
jgi:acetoacetyl-CoA synthetase